MSKPRHQNASYHQKALDMLIQVWNMPDCECCKAYASRLIEWLAAGLRGRVPEVGRFDVLTESQHLRGLSGKRRRMDMAYMRCLATEPLQERGASSVGAFVKQNEPLDRALGGPGSASVVLARGWISGRQCGRAGMDGEVSAILVFEFVRFRLVVCEGVAGGGGSVSMFSSSIRRTAAL